MSKRIGLGLLASILLSVPAAANATKATAYDVFGNKQTASVEAEIQRLQASYPRNAKPISDREATEAYKKLASLVDQISDKEQLLRIAYWGHLAHPSPYESEVDVVHETTSFALSRIKKLYPAEAQDAILEAAMLLRVDGHIGEMIDDLLSAKRDVPPEKGPPGVYVYIEEARNASTPPALALQFNVTRQFWSLWKQYWSGQPTFEIVATFAVDHTGKPQRIRIEKPENYKKVDDASLQKAATAVRHIIEASAPYGPVRKGARPVKVRVSFYG